MEIQGHWAVPDCGRYEEAVILSRYFYLKSDGHDIALLPAELDRDMGEYWIALLGAAPTPIRLENDGILKIATYAPGGPKRPKSWDDLNLDQKIEYTGCTEVPSIIPQTMVRLMRFIDRIAEQCTLSVSNDCTRVMFKFADADNDQRLSAGEIRRAVASGMIFAELADRGTLTAEESGKVVEAAKPEGAKIADDLIARYDADKSKNLDFNELMADFTPPPYPSIPDMAAKIGKLLPAFKVAAIALPSVPKSTKKADEKSLWSEIGKVFEDEAPVVKSDRPFNRPDY